MYELAQDIYHISVSNGPEHISVTGGYFQLGFVFQKAGRQEEAARFFDQIVAIWKKSLVDSIRLDGARVAEAVQMLTSIHEFRCTIQSSFSKSNLNANEVLFVLAQVYHSAGQYVKAKENATVVLDCIILLI